jgi:predicted acylesterase/phospholipase RssA
LLVQDERQHIGVAISGGGHRASLFGLGALLYLADAGKGSEIAVVSSVSGGSITNGYLGAHVDLTTASPDAVWSAAKPLAARIARNGLLFASKLTYLYLASMVLVLAIAVVVSFLAPGIVIAVAWVVAVVLIGWLALQRSRVAAVIFDRAFYEGRTLGSINSTAAHVICAADLQTAEDVFFSGEFVHCWRLGWGTPGDLPLARAVQASAALPGAFSVSSMPVSMFSFQTGTDRGASHLSALQLMDGGVYDNLATEWPIRLHRRIDEDMPARLGLVDIDQLLVVNGSAGQGVVARTSVKVPILAELASLRAVIDVLYDQTTAVRRRYLDLRFRAARGSLDVPDGDLAGTTIQIDRSPFELPDAFKDGTDELGERARAAIERLGEATRKDWADQTRANTDWATTLSKIPSERAASLVRHAYVLTMVNSHVLLDYPLLAIPDDAQFQDLVT